MTVHEWQVIEEEKALRALRKMVDNTSKKLGEPGLDEEASRMLMSTAKQWVLKVFPDKEDAYDLIYGPRFEKIYTESKR
jgi:hypothetical protein